MHHEILDGELVYAALSPELAAWVLRVLAKDLRDGRPHWARLDHEELIAFLAVLGDVVPARYRTPVSVSRPERPRAAG